jgi:hypothetical protein
MRKARHDARPYNLKGNLKMSENVKFKTLVTTTERFGGCPKCGKNDGLLNLGDSHYFFCEEHKTSWHYGSNIFSCWRQETDVDWDANFEYLIGFAEVTPLFPPPDGESFECKYGPFEIFSAEHRKAESDGLHSKPNTEWRSNRMTKLNERELLAVAETLTDEQLEAARYSFRFEAEMDALRQVEADGEKGPCKKGITVGPTKIRALIEELELAEAEMTRVAEAESDGK